MDCRVFNAELGADPGVESESMTAPAAEETTQIHRGQRTNLDADQSDKVVENGNKLHLVIHVQNTCIYNNNYFFNRFVATRFTMCRG